MARRAKANDPERAEISAISEITVAGFKSIREEQTLEIKPLTILAGANSSGKSSMIQPLLLLKQTLEAPYDAGPLLLNGPNVKFTIADQLLSGFATGPQLGGFKAGLRVSSGESFLTKFGTDHGLDFGIQRTETSWSRGTLAFWPGMSQAAIIAAFRANGIDLSAVIPEAHRQGHWEVRRDRCFIGPVWIADRAAPEAASLVIGARPGARWEEVIPHVIHLPALRGNPERTYPVTALGPTYAGTFEKYVASLILNWIKKWLAQSDRTIAALNEDLTHLRLSGGVRAKSISDVQIEIQVGRLHDTPPAADEDMMNLADVGFGVSQTLPVIVALHAARQNQLVYVEQPEIHLHPRAQFELAKVLASAAKRGVRLIIETHSSILLLGVQAQVAQEKLAPDAVKLHWFQQKPDGQTAVTSADLDEVGRFGDWPEDFDDEALRTQKEYLDAAEKRLFAK